MIDRLIERYKSVGWWAARLNVLEWPDMIAVNYGTCFFHTQVQADREIPIKKSLCFAKIKYLQDNQELMISFVTPDPENKNGVIRYKISSYELEKLLDGLRLRDLSDPGMRIMLNAPA